MLVVAVVVSFVTTRLQAEEFDLADWQIGEIVAGDKMDLDKLDGRVVAIEYWGPR